MAIQWISRDCVFAALDTHVVLTHYDIKAGRGTIFRIHCPFHDDDRPSCSINPQAKVFNCFACGEQGNILDFIAKIEDLDPKAEFRAVLEKAVEIIGHNPTPQKSDLKKRTKSDNSQREVPIVKNPIDDLSKRKPKKRKKKKSTERSSVRSMYEPDGSLELEANRILEGPAFPLKLQNSHPWLNEQLKRIGINRSVAEEMGIGFETRSNALMANRICFPIHNTNGELVAYAGRWASDETDSEGRYLADNGKEQPRYLLPKGFNKQLELYNWHRIREEFADMETIVLVEGFWTVLRLQAMTIPSVALMGLTISDAQIRLLFEGGIRSLIIMMDGDEPGQQALQTLLPKLASHFFIRSIPLPDGVKPDQVYVSVLTQVKALCAGTCSNEIPVQANAKMPDPKTKDTVKDQSTCSNGLSSSSKFVSQTTIATTTKASLSWNGLA